MLSSSKKIRQELEQDLLSSADEKVEKSVIALRKRKKRKKQAACIQRSYFYLVPLTGIAIGAGFVALSWKWFEDLKRQRVDWLGQEDDRYERYQNHSCPTGSFWFHPEYAVHIPKGESGEEVFPFEQQSDYCFDESSYDYRVHVPEFIKNLTHHLQPQVCIGLMKVFCEAVMEIDSIDAQKSTRIALIITFSLVLALAGIFGVKRYCDKLGRVNQREVSALEEIQVEHELTTLNTRNPQTALPVLEDLRYRKRTRKLCRKTLNTFFKTSEMDRSGFFEIHNIIFDYANLMPPAYYELEKKAAEKAALHADSDEEEAIVLAPR